MDPTTDTVVIDDDLAQGFAKLERAVANKPAISRSASGDAPGGQAPSAFEFRGGPRYTPILLAVVLPFAWLVVMYFALANLLSEAALDRSTAKDTEAALEQLERELQALRSEVIGAPRTAKTKPARPKGEKQPSKPAAAPSEDEAPPEEAPPEDEVASKTPEPSKAPR